MIWTGAENALAKKLAITGKDAFECAEQFPGRTVRSIRHKFQDYRREAGIIVKPGRVKGAVTPIGTGEHTEHVRNAEKGSRLLLAALVETAIRNGKTLPGLSPAHTVALAINLASERYQHDRLAA